MYKLKPWNSAISETSESDTKLESGYQNFLVLIFPHEACLGWGNGFWQFTIQTRSGSSIARILSTVPLSPG
jgi:hypothetical protein